MEIRPPISMKAWNSRMSPITNPTKPEAASQNQRVGEASKGRIRPRVIQENRERNRNPRESRIRLRERVPTRFPANSKQRTVTVQKIAVASAANSPRREPKVVLSMEGPYHRRRQVENYGK